MGQVLAFRVPTDTRSVEEALMGSLIMQPALLAPVRRLVEPSDFRHAGYGQLFAAMCRLQDSGLDADLTTLTAKEMTALKEADYLHLLSLATRPDIIPPHALSYARIIVEAACQQSIRDIGSMAEAETVLASAKRRLAIDADDREPHQALVSRVHDELLAPWDSGRDGLQTGILSLDAKVGGMKRGDMILVAARPTIGKTALVTTIAYEVAVRQGKGCAFFSLEMGRDQITKKLYCLAADMDWAQVNSHRLSAQEKGKLDEAQDVLADAPLDIVGPEKRDIEYLVQEAWRVHERMPLQLMVFDYVQLMKVSRKTDNRQQEVAYISSELKNLARQMDIPVLCVAQLNRQAEQRSGREPLLADLRDSGQLEQDADVALLLWEPDTENGPVKRIACNVAKHRLGEQGVVMLGFKASQMRFVELAQQFDYERIGF